MLPLLNGKAGNANGASQFSPASGFLNRRHGKLAKLSSGWGDHVGRSVATLHHRCNGEFASPSKMVSARYTAMLKPLLAPADHQIDSGRRLRWLILNLNLSQVEAARLMGVSKHVLRNWLAGDNPIQPAGLYRLTQLKGIDFNFVYLGDWSCLPPALARVAEAEALSILEGEPEPAILVDEKHNI